MEPVDSATRWGQWFVRGDGCVLTQVIDRLDVSCPPEWKRLREDQLRPYQGLVRPGSAWYSLETTSSHPGVALGVELVRDSELRGGFVCFAGPPDADLAAAWSQVMRLLDEGIVPAAQMAGASVWVPNLDDLFFADLQPEAADLLRRFSQTARKVLPLDKEEAELWRSFVIAAYRTRAIVDARAFVDWLVRQGWPRDAATELSPRFFDESLLLARYADEVSVA